MTKEILVPICQKKKNTNPLKNQKQKKKVSKTLSLTIFFCWIDNLSLLGNK